MCVVHNQQRAAPHHLHSTSPFQDTRFRFLLLFSVLSISLFTNVARTVPHHLTLSSGPAFPSSITMPALRRTPARNPYSTFNLQSTDSPDSGFNPAWAQAPPTPRNQPFHSPPKIGQPSFEFKAPEHQLNPQTPKPPGWFTATPNPTRNDGPPPPHISTGSGNPVPAPNCRVEAVKPGPVLDTSTFLAMLPFAAVYYVSQAVKSGCKSLMEIPGLGTQAWRNAMGWKVPRASKGKGRFDPISRRGRKTPKKEKASMLELPPYIVGATP